MGFRKEGGESFVPVKYNIHMVRSMADTADTSTQYERWWKERCASTKIFRKLILEIYNSILIGIKSTTFALNVRVSLSLLFLVSR